MSLANAFQLITALCFGVLTVGRPFMRSNSRTHLFWHTAIGVVGLVAVIAGTLLNSSTQKQYVDAFNHLSDKIGALAAPAETDPKQSTDQILAAAAAKLIDQQKQIGQLNSDVQRLKAQQLEDHSTKKMIRDLLTRIDSRLPAEIDAGITPLHFLMQPQDFAALQNLANRPDAAGLLKIVRGYHFESTSMMNCGSPGGICGG